MKTLFNTPIIQTAKSIAFALSIPLLIGSCTDKQKSNNNNPNNNANPTRWTYVDAGLYHIVALKSDGTLWAWGDNFYYQLGDGGNSDSYSPKQIGQNNDWIMVTAGRTLNYAIKRDGTLWAWGQQSIGGTYAGNGHEDILKVPTQIQRDNDWIDVSTASNHTLALKKDGTLYAWGLNNNGQIGNGTLVNQSVPIAIAPTMRFRKIKAGDEFSIAIATDGTLWAWGSNLYGNLANGTFTNLGPNTPAQIGTLNNWTTLAAAWGFVLALNNDGTLTSWGKNNEGQLGIGNSTNMANVQTISLSEKINKIDAMDHGSIAVSDAGVLYVWGDTHDKSPTRVASTYRFIEATVGYHFNAAISNEGILYTWGTNRDGVLGQGNNGGNSSELLEVRP